MARTDRRSKNAKRIELLASSPAPERITGRNVGHEHKCPLCGHGPLPVVRPIIRRGDISLRLNPSEVSWKEDLIPLTPLEADMLAMLICRGRVPFEALNQAASQRCITPAAREVMLHRIRRKFAAAGAPNPIRTIRGWGLVFQPDATAIENKSVLIGAAEAYDADIEFIR